MRSVWMLALAVSLALPTSGCEKDPPAPTQPSEPSDPAGVVIEQPGSDPVESEPQPGEAGEDPIAGQTKIVPTDVPCQSDDDCVKASCCHASTCVARADAPDCSQMMCTADCQAGTMDCNGGCLCQAGKCAARIWAPQ